MKRISNTAIAAAVLGFSAVSVLAANTWRDDFSGNPADRWSYFADTVMGGRSTGRVEFVAAPDGDFARMTGSVTTANNGGFIQIRTDLKSRPAKGLKGIRLEVRGNDQQYFVHLRTRGTRLPWQYYQADFFAGSGWKEVDIPFTDFVASGSFLRKIPAPETLKSIGLVAYGREHTADLQVRAIGFY